MENSVLKTTPPLQYSQHIGTSFQKTANKILLLNKISIKNIHPVILLDKPKMYLLDQDIL